MTPGILEKIVFFALMGFIASSVLFCQISLQKIAIHLGIKK